VTVCTCDPVYYVKGKPHPDVGGFNPDCATHGYPDDEWRAGSPLFPHRGYVDRSTSEYVTAEEARDQIRAEFPLRSRVADLYITDSMRFTQRYREETPREVTARLMRELQWGSTTRLPRPLRPCPPRELGQR
jgi:hypothetical protein